MRFHNRLDHPRSMLNMGSETSPDKADGVLSASTPALKRLNSQRRHAFTDPQEQINDSPENLRMTGYWISFTPPQGLSR